MIKPSNLGQFVHKDTLLDAPRLTVNETARRLKVHRSTIWRWILKGKLPSLHVFGRRFLLLADLEAFISSGSAGVSKPASRILSVELRSDAAAENLRHHGV